MIVVSTGWDPPTKQRCIDSVKAQKNACFEHVWIDASDQSISKPAMQNLSDLIVACASETIIVCLDLDDWLAHERVLERVQMMHDDGAWVTYGSYELADGRPGHAHAYRTTDYRHEEWLGTHLKTFRAGLFNRIKDEDKKYRGEWLYRAVDVATMLPCLEMAGPERVTYCPEVLYVYNWLTTFECSATQAEMQFEREVVADIRSREPYKRVECL